MKNLIPVIIILIIIIAIVLVYNIYFTPKIISIKDIYPETDDINKIEVVNGNTGERVSISNQKDIKEILNIIDNTELSKSRNQELKPGYSYDISFLKNDAIYFGISIAGNEIRIHKKVYIAKSPIINDIEMVIKKYY
ncbi:MAG: hypothetical protein K0R84_1509 [Clostridia bacterium]|jgi:hypothetical protein|nr:hypothetical protein [Clostridia bacterium]